jgi:uncharacterized membrane-anchored protein
MKKKILVILIACLWVAAAAGLIASKQQILKTGKTVVLETQPVDPRDLLRGDYVVLSYKISRLDLKGLKSEKQYYNNGEIVYVGLAPEGKYWKAVYVSSKKPGNGVFIKGRSMRSYTGILQATYGLESYFVPEDTGRELERGTRRGGRESLVVEAAVDAEGNALIKRVYLEKR